MAIGFNDADPKYFNTSLGLRYVLDRLPIPTIAKNGNDELVFLKFVDPVEASAYLANINWRSGIMGSRPDAFGRYPAPVPPVDSTTNQGVWDYQFHRLGTLEQNFVNQILARRQAARNSGIGTFLENPLGNIRQAADILKPLNPIASVATTTAIDHPIESVVAVAAAAAIAAAAAGSAAFGASEAAATVPAATTAGGLTLPEIGGATILDPLKKQVEDQLRKDIKNVFGSSDTQVHTLPATAQAPVPVDNKKNLTIAAIIAGAYFLI